VCDTRVVDLDWFVVVEDDGGLQMRCPKRGLVGRHVHWWLSWTEAVEPEQVMLVYLLIVWYCAESGRLLFTMAYL